MIKLFYKTGLIILLALVLSIGLDHFYRQANKLTYPFPNILPSPEIKDKYKIAKLGNSHSEEGITFEKYNVRSLNLASVAQTYEYDFALLKMHSRQIEKNAVIIINVSPISFSQKKPENEAKVNTQYYDGRLSPFLIPDLDISQYLQMQIVPFVRAGYLWRTTHAKEVKEKAMDTFAEKLKPTPTKTIPPVGSHSDSPAPVIPTPTPIRSARPTFNINEIQAELHEPASSTARLVESVRFMEDKWKNSGGFDTASFETNREDLQKIIDYSLEHNWRPVLVTLPINQLLLHKLGGVNYLKQNIYDNLAKIDTHGIPYINFATNPELLRNRYLYSNSDHLGKRGAPIVSYLLIQKLIDMGYLPKKADGYDYTPKKVQLQPSL